MGAAIEIQREKFESYYKGRVPSFSRYIGNSGIYAHESVRAQFEAWLAALGLVESHVFAKARGEVQEAESL